MKKKIFEDLSKICKTINYIDDESDIIKYSKDWRGRVNEKALCVVFPKNEDHISEILKYCFDNEVKVIPQGGNTNLVASASPSTEKREIIINMEKMNLIHHVDTINKCVEVDAGVVIDDLNSTLEKQDFLFPLEMASTGSSQVGGIISTNAGGINVLHYGSVRNNLLALDVVLSNGRILRLGSKVVKDNTGYNLKDLFCGSEGTLGIITKAILKIYPKSQNYFTFIASFENLKNLINFYEHISKEFRFPITGFEMIPQISFDLCIKHNFMKKSFFENFKNYYALVKIQIDNLDTQVINLLEEKLYECSNLYSEIIIAQNEKENKEFWKFRENLTEAQKLEGKLIGFDISIPLDKLDEFFVKGKNEIDDILKGIKFHTFGHLGDCNIHYNLIEPDNLKNNFYEYETKLKKVINNLVKKFSGSVSAEHGIGLLKRDDFLDTKDILEIKLMKKIKKTFDPKNILNQNKIFKM
jgi:FAD/FMN-containing dehydrogenase